ncbi:MAG: tetratricopeptide repeat protein [Chitinophagaceae bacterium]|nr:tetratricopeptide repeat protein [Chitinophagaceae bacterium]
MKNRRQIFFLFAIVISNNTNGQNWKLLTDSARIYQQKGEVHIAINYFERAEMLLKRDSSETAIYAQIQFAVGNLYADLGEFTKAVTYVQASKEIRERILGNVILIMPKAVISWEASI